MSCVDVGGRIIMRRWGVGKLGRWFGRSGSRVWGHVGGRGWHLRGKGRGRRKVEGAGSGDEEASFFKMVARAGKSVENHV
ncbi:hypothetical protein [Bartonella capreoli]|uniref:hypothetical protein n=1 Tax=Bartonella capreoli TaxID=155192 RepID=UPI001ABC2711|nr:hypothetical protein [Bartonella capreoli]